VASVSVIHVALLDTAIFAAKADRLKPVD